MISTGTYTSLYCRNCGKPLTLEEMHYFDNGDGTATCSRCEAEWSWEMHEWRTGKRKDMPERP